LSNSVRYIRHQVLITTALLFLLATTSRAQDWIRTGTGLGVEKVRLAAADFKPSTNDAKNAELLKTFNDVLWNDLDNAGIFDLVSKSFYPLQEPGQPSELISRLGIPRLRTLPCSLSATWARPPASSRCRDGSTT
jgi:hypothetical protein